MTDEEKARKGFHKHITENNCYFSKAEINIYKDGYLDGLAEGKPKWHDLRKNPNDLPKENGEYYGKVEYFGEQYRKIVFDIDRKRFDVTSVLAWCELPKFEE